MDDYERQAHIASEFRRRRVLQVLLLPALGPALGMVLWMLDDGPAEWHGIGRAWWLTVSLGVVLLCVAFSLFNWRCPACRRHLGKRFLIGRCPRCGVRLTPPPRSL